MSLYFEQQTEHVGRRVPRAASSGDDGIAAPFAAFVPAGTEVQAPPPPALRYAPRWSAMVGGDDADMNDEPKLGVWLFVGWEVQAVQPPAIRFWQKIAALLPGDAADINDQRPMIFPFAGGWEIQSFQPPVPARRPSSMSAALARGDDGNAAILVPPWVFATAATTFPDSQAVAAAAIPSWNAGPQIGAVKSMPNIITPTVLKAGPGTLFAVTVVVAGTAAGGAFDVNQNVAVNEFFVIPNTPGIYILEWPCQQGILLVPGAGQTLAAKWV